MLFQVNNEQALKIAEELPSNPDVVEFYNTLLEKKGEAVYVGHQFEIEMDPLHRVSYKFYAPLEPGSEIWQAYGVNPPRRELLSTVTNPASSSPFLRQLSEETLAEIEA